MSCLPRQLERELDALGVVDLVPAPEPEPRSSLKEMKFNMPELDENGEPNF